MNALKKHILFKFVTIVITIFLVIPTLVKFAHVFEEHHREICHGENETHLHTSDVDCEFYKFQLNHHFTIPFYTADIPLVEENHEIISTQYCLLKSYQKLHFSLRAPPIFI